MQQQQRQQVDLKEREEEYRQAQRSGVEAVAVGRETLEQATRQGEQLEHADSLADETSYKLEKAGRILRGMTWSGWVANAFAKSVTGPPTTKSKEPSFVYENVPDVCRGAAQALQNYHANVQVMEECETLDQKETLLVICNSMFDSATAKLDEIDSKSTADAYVLEFRSHLALLRERQQKAFALKRQSPQKTTRGTGEDRAELLSGTSTTTSVAAAAKKPENPHLQLQDAHLQVLSENLGELGHIARSLSQAVANQSDTIHSLDSKADHITETSKMVTRRADRMIQKKSWSPVKPVFAHTCSIRHISSGRYLTVVEGKSLQLLPRFQKETAVFGAWVRQGNIFGLQNRATRRWMGQNLLGYVACSAGSFGRREEWEADDKDDWKSTRLLCTSVGWGAGGYVQVNESDFSIRLGGSGVEERKKADLWCISEYVEE
jgi:hypothetical protein